MATHYPARRPWLLLLLLLMVASTTVLPELGERIMAGFKTELAGVAHVKDIRGMGCMIGIELDRPCKSLFMTAMAQGLIINVTADSVIRLLPPMIMTDSEADQLVAILAPLIKDFKTD